MSKTAWIYVRESTEEQLSGHSPETQERECRTLASRLGYTVTNVEWESGTARNMRERKVWQHINRAMRQHKMDAIIVYAYSRLHRNFINQVEMLAAAKRAGVEVLSATEYADPANKSSKMLVYMAAMFNEMESDTIRERTMGGTRTRALRGMPLVGKKAPYGYQWVTRMDTSSVTGASRARKVALVPHPVEAERLRALFLYLDAPDRSLTDAVNWLNAQGWPSPQGGMWRKTTVRYLINQPVYWGEGEAFRSQLVEVPVTDATGEVELVKRPRLRAPEERIKLPVENAPALVDAAVAERVHANIAARREHRASTSHLLKRDDFWLRGGLLRCGICGGSLSPRRRTGRSDFYTCHAGASAPAGHPGRHTLSVKRESAELNAFTALMLLVTDSAQVEAALHRLTEHEHATHDDLASAESALADVDKRLATLRKLAEVLSEEEMADFADRFAALRKEREGWLDKRAALTQAQAHSESLVDALLKSVKMVREQVQRVGGWEQVFEHPDRWTPEQLEKMTEAGLSEKEADRLVEALIRAPEWRQALQALDARIVVMPERHSREGGRRMELRMPLSGVDDGTHSGQLRSGFWPVAVSASHASSTPTMSCWA